jgi:putative flippase GtrA
MDSLLPQLIGYGLASGVALGFDMGSLIALTHVGMPYLPASALAFTIGAIVAYLLSIRYVFATHVIQNRALEFSTFLSLGIAGLLMNLLVMRLAVGSLGATLIAAKCVAACCTFGTNFALRRQLLFRARRVPR